MGLAELRAQVEASRAQLDGRGRDARLNALDTADQAAAHAELENKLERELWVQAQRDLGVADEDIDADRRVVTHLPLGPVHVATDTGIVTYHPDSDEADTIRTSPGRGAELAQGQPTNAAAHKAWGTYDA